MDNEEDRLLMIVAIVAVTMAVVASIFVYYSMAGLSTKISGFASSTGTANLTVENSVIINFTTSAINWGSGKVSIGQQNATLISLEGTGNVTNGNWTLLTSGGLQIQNIGNMGVSLNLTAGKTAANFIGGTQPWYQWNVSSTTGACVNNTVLTNLSIWSNTSTTETVFCGNMSYLTGNRTVRVDIKLIVPYDSKTGALSDTITAHAEAAL